MSGLIDSVHEKHIEDEAKYWIQVLDCVVNLIKLLAERGLPFRGHDEKCGLCTNGNVVGLLELPAKYIIHSCRHTLKSMITQEVEINPTCRLLFARN